MTPEQIIKMASHLSRNNGISLYEDLIQEGNLVLIKNPQATGMRVRGAMIDFIRKWSHYDRERRTRPVIMAYMDDKDDLVIYQADVETCRVHQITLQQLMARLCRRSQMILHRLLEGETLKGIGLILGISEAATCMAFHVAVKKMQRMCKLKPVGKGIVTPP